MKTHTTFTLQTLIANDMDVAKHKMTNQQINVWIETLPSITAEMFDTIHFFTHSIFQKRLISRQICQIQKECVRLLDLINKYTRLPQAMSKLKQATIKCLEQVLDKIETDCSVYADDEILMPIMHLRREQVSVESQMNLLSAHLKDLDADPKLQKLVLDCMKDLLKSNRCYYYRMAYVKKLQASLIQLCKRSDKDNIDFALCGHLVMANYNTPDFIKFYQEKIIRDLEETNDAKQKFSSLYDYQRQFQNYQSKKSVAYIKAERTRIKDTMLNFVCNELDYLKKKEALLKPVVAPIAAPPVKESIVSTASKTDRYKIRTSFSVDALAYFIKLQVSAEVIEPGIRTELLNFIASIFHTPGTGSEGISAGSLNNKYKQTVQTTAINVRAALMRMLKMIDKEFDLG